MKNFSVEICSDPDYEEVVAHLIWKENYSIAIINQENGIDNIEMEIFVPLTGTKSRVFEVDEFLNALEFSKERLIDKES